MRERALALLGFGLRVERRAVEVRTPVADDARHPRLARPAPRFAGERDRARGRAVVAAVRGQHLVPPGVQARHAHRVLVRLRAAVGEEHDVEIARRALGDQARRLAAHVDRERGRHRAELGRLLLDRGDEPRVLVADVDVDELRAEIEVAVAVVVPEVRALRRARSAADRSAPAPTTNGRRARDRRPAPRRRGCASLVGAPGLAVMDLRSELGGEAQHT